MAKSEGANQTTLEGATSYAYSNRQPHVAAAGLKPSSWFGAFYRTPIAQLRSEDFQEHERWLDFELKARIGGRTAEFEYKKISAGFSKLIVSSLITINSGSLVALPAIALFLGEDKFSVKNKLQMFGPSAVSYSLGVLLALLTAFAVYKNMSYLALSESAALDVYINDVRRYRQKLRFGLGEAADKGFKEAADRFFMSHIPVNSYYILGQSFGWASIYCFIIGCILLLLFAHSR